jgi:hypothetical protein
MVIIYDDGDLKRESRKKAIEEIDLYDIDETTWFDRALRRPDRSPTDVVLFRRASRFRLFKSRRFPTETGTRSREFTQQEFDALTPQ